MFYCRAPRARAQTVFSCAHTAGLRNRVQVVGIKGRPELNGKSATIGELNEAKGRYPVHLEGGEAVMIKMMNLVSIGD